MGPCRAAFRRGGPGGGAGAGGSPHPTSTAAPAFGPEEVREEASLSRHRWLVARQVWAPAPCISPTPSAALHVQTDRNFQGRFCSPGSCPCGVCEASVPSLCRAPSIAPSSPATFRSAIPHVPSRARCELSLLDGKQRMVLFTREIRLFVFQSHRHACRRLWSSLNNEPSGELVFLLAKSFPQQRPGAPKAAAAPNATGAASEGHKLRRRLSFLFIPLPHFPDCILLRHQCRTIVPL